MILTVYSSAFDAGNSDFVATTERSHGTAPGLLAQ